MDHQITFLFRHRTQYTRTSLSPVAVPAKGVAPQDLPSFPSVTCHGHMRLRFSLNISPSASVDLIRSPDISFDSLIRSLFSTDDCTSYSGHTK